MNQGQRDAAVRVQNVAKRYGTHVVLSRINLSVAKGEVVALLGPSGAGKSTLLRCINHLDDVDEGAIFVDGELIGYREAQGKLYELSEREVCRQRARIGMVFQHFNLFRHLTALENVMLGPTAALRTKRDTAEPSARALLAKVGLAEKASSYPNQLSGGQQQRVAIARALAMEPALLLLDEPTSALDPQLAGEVVATIQTLAAEGRTMLIATHDMTIAREVSDRVIFMADAQVVETQTSRDFFATPQTDRARVFLTRAAASPKGVRAEGPA